MHNFLLTNLLVVIIIGVASKGTTPLATESDSIGLSNDEVSEVSEIRYGLKKHDRGDDWRTFLDATCSMLGPERCRSLKSDIDYWRFANKLGEALKSRHANEAINDLIAYVAWCGRQVAPVKVSSGSDQSDTSEQGDRCKDTSGSQNDIEALRLAVEAKLSKLERGMETIRMTNEDSRSRLKNVLDATDELHKRLSQTKGGSISVRQRPHDPS